MDEVGGAAASGNDDDGSAAAGWCLFDSLAVNGRHGCCSAAEGVNDDGDGVVAPVGGNDGGDGGDAAVGKCGYCVAVVGRNDGGGDGVGDGDGAVGISCIASCAGDGGVCSASGFTA